MASRISPAAAIALSTSRDSALACWVAWVRSPSTAATPADVVALLDELPLVTRDVEIGRRLYRSGESEYLIDGEVCRLRDIHYLLMDSGLGVKAYAVIEQTSRALQ